MLHYHARFSMSDILGMTFAEREWFLERMVKQVRAENALAKRGR